MARSASMTMASVAMAAVVGAMATGAAHAGEVYMGGSAHAVDLPTSLETDEGGADFQCGYRTDPIESLHAIGRPSAYLHAQISLNGDTNVAAVGLSWKIGDRLYLRPGIGLAVHDDTIPDYRARDGKRVDLGSRILFAPELALGYRLAERLAVEASWVHISNATLLSGQNAGMDFIGARLVFRLD